MELSIQTSPLLFPAISLLMLSYTNRFLAIAALIRKLSADFETALQPGLLLQIKTCSGGYISSTGRSSSLL